MKKTGAVRRATVSIRVIGAAHGWPGITTCPLLEIALSYGKNVLPKGFFKSCDKRDLPTLGKPAIPAFSIRWSAGASYILPAGCDQSSRSVSATASRTFSEPVHAFIKRADIAATVSCEHGV